MLPLGQTLSREPFYPGRPVVAETRLHGDQVTSARATPRHVLVVFAGCGAGLGLYSGWSFREGPMVAQSLIDKPVDSALIVSWEESESHKCVHSSGGNAHWKIINAHR